MSPPYMGAQGGGASPEMECSQCLSMVWSREWGNWGCGLEGQSALS